MTVRWWPGSGRARVGAALVVALLSSGAAVRAADAVEVDATTAAEFAERGEGRPLPGGGLVVEQQTTPSAEVEAGRTTVGIAADSIGLDLTGDIADIVGQSFPIVYNEMYLGSAIRHHYYRVAEAVQGPNGPDVMVVILGTAETNHEPSSAEFRLHMRRFLDAVSPHVDCVRWFDTQTADASGIYWQFNKHHERLNALIHEVTAEYDNVEYVHYGAWTEIAPPGYIDVDQLHLARRGRIELGRMITQAARGCDEATDVADYWDVKTDYWAADAIEWITGEGLASGFENHTFRARIGGLEPEVTRGQVAAMLWRLAGSPSAAGHHGWSDGPAWLRGALDWLAETGLAGGYPDGRFRPDRSISRGQVAGMLWRLAGSPPAEGSHPWTDGAPWVDGALDWAYEHDLLAGFDDGTVRPGDLITRAQIANLLQRFAPLSEAAAASPPSRPPESSTSTTTAATSSTVSPPTAPPIRPPVSADASTSTTTRPGS